MEKVTVKDIKAKMSHYLDRMEAGEVFEVRGMHIGRVYGFDSPQARKEDAEYEAEKGVELSADDIKEQIEDHKESVGISPEKFLEKIGKVEGHKNYLQVEEPVEEVKVPEWAKCKICRLYKKEEMWEGEEDGVDFVVCEGCVRNRWGAGYKAALGGMRRFEVTATDDKGTYLKYPNKDGSKKLTNPDTRGGLDIFKGAMFKVKKEKKNPFNKK